MDSPPRTRRWLDTALSAVFVAGLFVPLADFAVRPMSVRSAGRESRLPAPPPAALTSLDDLLRWPSRAERWWNDWFGVRDVLISTRNRLLWRSFDLAPTDLVVRGRDGWLFFQGQNDLLQADRGAQPFAPEAVAAWKRVFEARRAWCAARGIRFLVAFAPSKARIYPERLPPAFARLGPSRLEQVREALGAEWDDAWIELESVLLAEKARDAVDDPSYAPFGVHWNDRGAYAAYRAIIACLARRAPWAERLYLDGVLRQRVQRWRLLRPAATVEPPLTSFVREARFTRADAPLGKAYFLHDSFGPDVRQWLGEHFRETWSRWQYGFDPKEIAAFAPDVVVLLFSDRYFGITEPTLSPDEIADGPDGRLKRWESASELLLRFEPKKEGATLRSFGKVALERTPDGLVIDTRLSSDYVELPKFEVEGSAPLVVRLVVDSPLATTLQLFYKTRAAPRFVRGAALSATLHEGVNEVFFELPASDLLGELALRPGVDPGRYVLREFEVRR
jgi:hypothetical protein